MPVLQRADALVAVGSCPIDDHVQRVTRMVGFDVEQHTLGTALRRDPIDIELIRFARDLLDRDRAVALEQVDAAVLGGARKDRSGAVDNVHGRRPVDLVDD